MRPAMEELVRQYEAETGQKVEIDYGGSGENMIKAETTRRGDLYVAHDPFHGAMIRKGLAEEGWVVGAIKPMIAVPKGNPKGIAGLKDLTTPGIKIVLTDPQYSTTGHIYRVMFKKAGIEEAIATNVVTRTRGGGAAANQVVMGHADAAIVWNAVIHARREKLDAVDIETPYRPDPKVDAVTTATFGPIDMSHVRVTIDVLASSKQPEAARAFAEFVASARAEKVWEDFGFSLPRGPKHLPPERDAGAANAPGTKTGGSLLIYCGAGLRPAVEEAADAFTAKTGIRVERDYGGSGMLISRLRLAKRGDLFMPGDVWYVELAEKEGLVESKSMVCYFVPVILVQKGNPKNIRTLADLARPGVRLGLGDPKACQIGRLCETLFAKNNVEAAALHTNRVYTSVTVNELGLQIKAGALDATVVWDAVASLYPDTGEVVPIPMEQNIISRVAIGLLKCSEDRARAQQFVDFLLSDAGKAIFRNHNYRTKPPQ